MKKTLIALFCALAMAGCSTAEKKEESSDNTKVSIVTTIFPAYDWCREILGENPDGAELTYLLDSGVDLHSYQPTVADMVKIAECDMFVYVGGESDEWVADALKESVNPDLKAVSLMEVLSDSVKEEEIKEGMEHEEEHEDHEETEYDEHVWLSLKRAQQAVEYLCQAICEKDPAGSETYKANAEEYIASLARLDAEYTQTVSEADFDTLVFADRFPFRYMTDDYGLDYYAAFAGCSAETEASFNTVRFLAEKVTELGLDCVLTIENSDEKIARTVIENTDGKAHTILHMNSMQSAVKDENGENSTYLAVMKSNLSVLEEALTERK